MNDPAEMRVGGPGLGAMGGGKLSMGGSGLPCPARIDAAVNDGARRACDPPKEARRTAPLPARDRREAETPRNKLLSYTFPTFGPQQ